jgi:CIC family chloride channel protein
MDGSVIASVGSASNRRWNDVTRMALATLAAGTLGGVASAGFQYVTFSLGDRLFSWANSGNAFSRVASITLPLLGFLLAGLVLQLVPQSRVGGVRAVVESIQHRQSFVPLVRLLNVFLSGLVMAFGGSVGPAGPVVQLGALIGSKFGEYFQLGKSQLETLVRAGAAAAVAAAFRSPAGAVFLTVEVFGARFDSGLVAISVAAWIGYFVRMSALGDTRPFVPAVPLKALPAFTLFVIIPLMGLAAACAGCGFIWLFNRTRSAFPQRWPLLLRLAVGGAIVGVIGGWFPQVLSAGWSTIRQGLDGKIGFQLVVVLVALKMLATSVTFGSGAVGGLFSPILVIGSLFGGAFAYAVRTVLPWAVPQPELFVLLGMIAMFGSIAKAYWSGLLVVADLSGSYNELLLPGLIAGGIAYLISSGISERSIFGLPIESPHLQPAVESKAATA